MPKIKAAWVNIIASRCIAPMPADRTALQSGSL